MYCGGCTVQPCMPNPPIIWCVPCSCLGGRTFEHSQVLALAGRGTQKRGALVLLWAGHEGQDHVLRGRQQGRAGSAWAAAGLDTAERPDCWGVLDCWWRSGRLNMAAGVAFGQPESSIKLYCCAPGMQPAALRGTAVQLTKPTACPGLSSAHLAGVIAWELAQLPQLALRLPHRVPAGLGRVPVAQHG